MSFSYETATAIDAPPERVWSILVDVPGYARWNEAVVSIRGRIALGERLELVSVANPKRTFRPKVTRLDPPGSMVWGDGMPLGLFRGERTYTIASDGNGGSRFHMKESFSGPMAGVIGRSIPDLTPSMQLFAAGLKTEAERAG